jgi:hypothetical protein
LGYLQERHRIPYMVFGENWILVRKEAAIGR